MWRGVRPGLTAGNDLPDYRRADQDIIDIYLRGAAEFGTKQAENYHQELMELFALLTQNPQMAREGQEFDPPVRLHPHKAHMIVYLARDHEILVIRLLHRRQEWERHL